MNTCSTCKYWVRLPADFSASLIAVFKQEVDPTEKTGPSRYGQCRRNPPVVSRRDVPIEETGRMFAVTITEFPDTLDTAWCGEHAQPQGQNVAAPKQPAECAASAPQPEWRSIPTSKIDWRYDASSHRVPRGTIYALAQEYPTLGDLVDAEDFDIRGSCWGINRAMIAAIRTMGAAAKEGKRVPLRDDEGNK